MERTAKTLISWADAQADLSSLGAQDILLLLLCGGLNGGSKKLTGHIGFGLSMCPFVMLFDACHIL